TACVGIVKIKGGPDTVFIVGLGIAADPTAYSGLGQQKLDFMVTEQIVWLRSGLGTVTYMGLGCVASGGLVVHLGIRGQGIAALIGIEIILGQATFLGISGPSTEKEKTWIPMVLHFLDKSAVHVHPGTIAGIVELCILAAVLVYEGEGATLGIGCDDGLAIHDRGKGRGYVQITVRHLVR